MKRSEFILGGEDFKRLTAAQLMEIDVKTFTPEAAWEEMAEAMTKWHFGSVPIVDAEDRLLGVVGEEDLLSALIEGKDLSKITALDIMGKKPVTVTEDTNAGEIGTLLQKERLIRVPVVKGGKLVGVVARRDLLFGYLRATSKPPLWL
ncbi:MAG: CBS domain-containing protein [Deltaproteobacteria bacterium]|nr:CBS domain-containing protein [Deltaproteobacteria bacterium]